MSPNRTFCFIFFFSLAFITYGQKVEPAFWWANMPNKELQIMIYEEGIGQYRATIEKPGITINRQITGDSPNYIFLYLTIDPDVSGDFDINLSHKKKQKTIPYSLLDRETDLSKNQGFNSSDVIYLLMPDRFANGDESNDTVEGMLEGVDRTNPNGRHGGDIKGIQNHLGYIKDLGMTAVWLTPVFENDMTSEYGAYHGYAATDLYKIDRRYGSNAEFKQFVQTCHQQGIKVIMDMIHNHIGDKHWWMSDLPTKDWIHDLEKYGTTSYRSVVQSDPYASEYDLNKLQKAWFVNEMPDLNQKNVLLADYLIQNTIWWIEFSGIDGIRMDTYVYPYKDYMARWVSEVLNAYPNFNIVGESWVETVVHESYWQKDLEGESDGYDSKLPNVTDFQIQFALRDAMTQPFGWSTGLMQLYYVISQDRLYSNPLENVIFMDNHDLERFYSQIDEKEDLFKMSYAYLMTTRGIPQVYYGTELMLPNANTEGDSRKRADMMGGWPNDARSVFKASERTQTENEIYNYIKTLTSWRKEAKAIHEGKTLHFVPNDNVYVYFRYTSTEAVMVIMNMNDKPKTIETNKYKEMLSKFKRSKNILTGEFSSIETNMTVPGKVTQILELIK